MMTSSKIDVILATILVSFERSYVVPQSSKVSQPGFNKFRIYVGGEGGRGYVFRPQAI